MNIHSIHKVLTLFKRTSTIVFYILISIQIIRASAWAGDQSLPSLGDASSSTVSLNKEHQIGKIFLQALYKQVKIIHDPITQNYLENLIYKLAATSELADKRITVVLIDDRTLNAFAAPGGIVGINTGLILYAKNEEELAAILAHELAHLSQRHFSRNLQDRKLYHLPTMAGIIGGLLLMAANPNIGLATIASSVGASASHQLSFSREQEAEADQVGIKNLYRAGMNPYAMPEMFKKLQRLEGRNSEALEFLRTHPITTNRIAETTGRAAQFPKHYYKTNSYAFGLIQMRIRLMQTDAKEMISQLQSEIKQQKVTDPDVAQYGLALSLYHDKQLSASKKELTPLLKQHPQDITLQYLSIRTLYANGSTKAALKESQQLLLMNPGNFPATILYAKLLYHSGNYKKSRLVLRNLLVNRPNDPFVWKLLADTTGKAGNIVEYYMANAHYLQLTGSAEAAIHKLQYALNSQRMPYEQRKAMQQQLITLQKDKKMADDLTL